MPRGCAAHERVFVAASCAADENQRCERNVELVRQNSNDALVGHTFHGRRRYAHDQASVADSADPFRRGAGLDSQTQQQVGSSNRTPRLILLR